MVRTYKNIKDIDANFNASTVEAAVKLVVKKNTSIKKAAADDNIKKSTLSNYIRRYKVEKDSCNFKRGKRHRQIFDDKMKLSLCSYILTCSKLFYRLTSAAVRRLAYQYTLKNKISMPASWTQNEMAGYDWLHSFLKRSTNISLRTSESTSLARMSSFNRFTVNTFFQKVADVYRRYGFNTSEIFNLDEVISKINSLCAL